MKASAWSGCWAVGTVIPQWMPCPLDPTIWEDALALCSRETCLLWLDEYIRIHNTELAISNSLETIQIFLSKPGASCGVFTGWGVMAEQPRKRTQMSEGGEAFAMTPTGRPRLFVGKKYRRNTERSVGDAGNVSCSQRQIWEWWQWIVSSFWKTSKAALEHPVDGASGRRGENAGIWWLWYFQT